MNSDIWIGDLARVLDVLGPMTPGNRAQVAGLLGLDITALPPEAMGSAPDAGPEAADSHPPDIGTPAEQEPPAAPRLTLEEELPLLDPLGTALVPQSVEWQEPALAEMTAGHLVPRIPFLPLLAPHSADATLRAAVSRWVHVGPVDTDALVRDLARQQPVRVLPLKPIATLRFGAQVLVDLGRGMDPFIHDRRDVLRQLRNVVGREGLTVRYFRYAPLRGVSGAAAEPESSYSPPPPGTRVLVVSDMGIGGPPGDFRRSTPEEWESFKRLIESHDCPATALVPFPPHRWPSWLVQLFPLISWDHHTTAGEAARRVRHR
jgi:hypothetical protein